MAPIALDPRNAPDLWRLYGRHAAVMLSAGPRLHTISTEAMFAVLSGAQHVDLNQLAIFGPAGVADAVAAVAVVEGADVPALIAVSGSVADAAVVGEVLQHGGFTRLAEREALFWAPSPPPVAPSPFDVRRAIDAADLSAIWPILHDAHGYEPELAAMYGALLRRPDVGCWLAWDGPRAICCAFVTRVGTTLGVFDMTTLPEDRRRGAGRGVLTWALAEAANWDNDGVDGVIFWATPAGRPMYESLGFRIADEMDVYTIGASPEDLAAVGAAIIGG